MIDHEALRARLPDIGDGLAAAFATLHQSPEPDACEALAARLQGAQRHVLWLREGLVRRRDSEAVERP